MTLLANEQYGGGEVRDVDGRIVVVVDGAGGVAGAATTVGQATGQGHVLLFAPINTAAAGATALVAASPSNKIKVVSYVVVASGAVTVQFQSAAVALTGAMSLAVNGGVVAIGQPSAHLFETAVNTVLNITLGGAVQVSGHVAYITEP